MGITSEKVFCGMEKDDCPKTLTYCDPPYQGTEGYGIDFGLEGYTAMADLEKHTKGKMTISVNDVLVQRPTTPKACRKGSCSIRYDFNGGTRLFLPADT